jgi:putative endonuclease
MPKDVTYFVYIAASRSRNLYIGVTNSLVRRMEEHRNGESTFTSRYKIERLIYYEAFQYVNDAIRRETVLKGWTRARKLSLIESLNPGWVDLSADFGKIIRYQEPDK